ncbi:hypothetical protein [Winogradskyella sp. PG-2]|uniref:hypothetical protein n=1 Tax=Winogradskyella sp. PG-2 TaxID=754409 RepID=UPI001E48A8E8|nr:hypothetical protein [Winogradskyella sp. PG-2]
MKYLLLMFILCLGINVNDQKSESENVKAKIIEFFDAFHKQDSTALESMVMDNIILHQYQLIKTVRQY